MSANAQVLSRFASGAPPDVHLSAHGTPSMPTLEDLALESFRADDSDRYRALARRHAASVTVVTVRRRDGALDGFTATAFLTVSLAPPIVLVSATNDSQAAAMLSDASSWAVNLLADHQRPIADLFATPHHLRGDAFAKVIWGPDDDGAPLLQGALGAYSARVRSLVPAGDHTLCLGDVTAVHLGPDGPALVYRDRRYGAFTADG
jgi:flavin reductase (DIM6/NTAB) family NADH-FMN oxidoreductase RutF